MILVFLVDGDRIGRGGHVAMMGWQANQSDVGPGAGTAVFDREHADFALGANRTGLWAFHQADERVVCDARVQALIGARSSDLPVDDFLNAFPGEAGARLSALLSGTDDEHDLDLPTRRLDTGETGWITVSLRHCARTGSIIGTARDISDLKRHDTHVHMLMREVTHRSKNLLAIIQAMARQTVKDSLSAADFEARFSARLRGLSFSHELLASQDWRCASLTELAEGHLSPLRDQHRERVTIAGPVVFVRPEAAQNIGLALNELGSNAQRYGALSGPRGTVRLEWHIDADGQGPQALHMVWTEAGAATDLQPPSHQGFGHKVMERVVARALDARVTMAFAPTGLRWSLRIPLDHIASEQAA